LAGSACLLPGAALLLAQGHVELGLLRVQAQPDLLPALLLVLGFGVKVPVWPCTSWLLKAHVEASVEFSILLSGLIVKFGALGLARVLMAVGTTPAAYLLGALALLGMWEATWRLFGQRDLKRVVALTTVIEMNWLTLSLALGGLAFEQLFAFIAVAHSLTTVTEFFVAECLSRRFATRDITRLGGVYQAAPGLWVATVWGVLVTIGFPGTSLFVAKLYFLAQLCGTSLGLWAASLVLFMLILPLFFVRLWVPIWFGHGRSGAAGGLVPELSGRELLVLGCSLGGSVLLGVWPTLGLSM
jgi:NADH:ubiquinone oxidoreductase subunit 4 (subunit M)